MNRLIIPGILTDSLDDFRDKVKKAGSFSQRVGVDVIDGIFADNLTVMPNDMREIDWRGMSVDMQLMVEEPVDYLGELHLLKVTRAIGHIEKMGKPDEFINVCKELNIGLGWGFDLYTPLEAIDGELLLEAGVVLLMSVKAGFSGQRFNDHVLDKISKLRNWGFEGDIVVDGGIDEDTIPMCLKAGANQFSVTSAIWKANESRLRYEELAGLLKDS